MNDKVNEALKKAKEFYNSLVNAKIKVPGEIWVKGAATITLIDKALSLDPWQPIETAPRDGSKFIATWWSDIRQHWSTAIIYWDTRDCCTYWKGCYHGSKPTHWMPLPKPPGKEI